MRTPLVVGLAICVIFVVLFAIVARKALQGGGVNEFDTRWALDMKQHSEDGRRVRDLMLLFSFLGGIPAMTGLAAFGAFWLYRRGTRQLALAWCLIAAGGGALDLILKTCCDRDRPPQAWRDLAVEETNESFPSGHSMGSLIGYGLAGYVGTLRRRQRWRMFLVLVPLAGLVLAIGFSRVYLRAHWFTDVVGGFLIGAAWLSLCVGVVESHRWRVRAAGESDVVPGALSTLSSAETTEKTSPPSLP